MNEERRVGERREENVTVENRLISEIKSLQEQFEKTTTKLIKDVQRQEKIMERSDKRQKQEYDELQRKLSEVMELQIAQKDLLDAFIKLIANAIDAKSKYTGGHCERVPELALMVADAAHLSEEGIFAEYKIGMGMSEESLVSPLGFTIAEKLSHLSMLSIKLQNLKLFTTEYTKFARALK